MSSPNTRADLPDADHDLPFRTFWTVPNVLCLIRIAGSVVLLGIAWQELPRVFFAWYLFLAATDWLDGKLAIRWHQRTVIGARLDSLADVLLYGAVLLGMMILEGDTLLAEWPWIATAVGSYLISSAYGYWKFGKIPNYHTRGAKTSWLLMIFALWAMLFQCSLWPLRMAMLGVTLTNLEAIAITTILPKWQADVISVFRARSIAAASRQTGEALAGVRQGE